MDVLHTTGTVFFVGIKGAAMANLAVILKKMGMTVTGSDTAEEFITDERLRDAQINIHESFDPSVLPADTAYVIYSAAHGGVLSRQVIAAKEKGIPVMHQAELIGALVASFPKSIAVCGTHGKTTTTSFLTYALSVLGMHPSYLVGTSSFTGAPGGMYDGADYFVVEADEYGIDPPRNTQAKFLYMEPHYALVTNIDFDHPDVYADIEATEYAFRQFFEQITETQGGTLFLNADDERIMKISKVLPDDSFRTYGYHPDANVRILDVQVYPDKTVLTIQYNKQILKPFTVQFFGGGYELNTAGVILVLLELGFSQEAIRKAIQGFTGAKRRFEQVFRWKGIVLFDDYAHHPAEISATLRAARSRFPHKKIHVVFQPHTFSRTEKLQNEFIRAFTFADHIYLSPIFPSARESATHSTITSESLAQASGETVHSFQTPEELRALLKEHFTLGDIIFTMGAGDVYKCSHDIISFIRTFARQSKK